MLGGSFRFTQITWLTLFCRQENQPNPPIVNAWLVPGKQQRVDIDGLHVELAHARVQTPRETARQHGVKGVGGIVDMGLPC